MLPSHCSSPNFSFLSEKGGTHRSQDLLLTLGSHTGGWWAGLKTQASLSWPSVFYIFQRVFLGTRGAQLSV